MRARAANRLILTEYRTPDKVATLVWTLSWNWNWHHLGRRLHCTSILSSNMQCALSFLLQLLLKSLSSLSELCRNSIDCSSSTITPGPTNRSIQDILEGFSLPLVFKIQNIHSSFTSHRCLCPPRCLPYFLLCLAQVVVLHDGLLHHFDNFRFSRETSLEV
jgi:hypothetical protein